ncbi:flagellar basal-body MS-ring/collar protein FliF [Buchnera aphidicola]|uniref:flagellar basal-body MS-ring/collar protein FliF n=1 Tax=Buchnera aphidicola TaxID=9 RepID=UPI0034648635
MNVNSIQNIYEKFRKKIEFFLRNSVSNFKVLFFIIFLIITGIIFFSLWGDSSEYSLLYENLSNKEKKIIVKKLENLKIPYQFIKNSNSLLVPSEKINDLHHLALNKSFLKRSEIGFELLDDQKFGISQFNEKINYQRALEGELSRTIQKLTVVNDARVHIAWPKSSLFIEEKKDPSASVFLEIKPDAFLNSDQINAIKNLVANSIAGLSVNKVVVLDQFGQLLDESTTELSFSNDIRNKYISRIEFQYKNKIKTLLQPIFGSKNIKVEVTAQINFNEKERTNEVYHPNKSKKNQSVRSEEKSIDEKVASAYLNFLKNQISSSKNFLLSNLKKNIFDEKNLENSSDFLKKNNKNINFLNIRDFNNKTKNYELNHTVSHTRINSGEIKKLSVGIAINYLKNEFNQKKEISKSDLKKIKNLVKGAIGYSLKRGDKINIINTIFSENNFKKPKIIINSSNGFHFFIEYKKVAYLLFFIGIFLFGIFFYKKNYFFLKNKHLRNNSLVVNKKNKKKRKKNL